MFLGPQQATGGYKVKVLAVEGNRFSWWSWEKGKLNPKKLYFGQKQNKGKKKNFNSCGFEFSLQHPGTLGIKDNIPDDDPVTLTYMEDVQEMPQCLYPTFQRSFRVWSLWDWNIALGLVYRDPASKTNPAHLGSCFFEANEPQFPHL